MGHRGGPAEVIWSSCGEAFDFLGERWGFAGPERTGQGVAFHRLGLHVLIELVAWKHEAEFVTTLSLTDPDGRERRASLACLYLACGLGAAQDVPASAGTSRHTIVRRIGQHAAALGHVMPYLEGPGAAELFRRCERRERPRG
jgi:hypothetical protein